MFFLAGIVFGLLTAATGGIDFFKGWLIAAYVLVAALILFNASPPCRGCLSSGATLSRRRRDDAPRTRSFAKWQRLRLLLAGINAALFVAIIVDMVVKPF